MYCTKCGFTLAENAHFCPECGKPVGNAASGPGAAKPAEGKRLVRDMRQKKIAGVCAGFANYLDVDLTLVRIVWLCALFLWGTGLIGYLICWAVMPKDFGEPAAPEAAATQGASEPGPATPETKPDEGASDQQHAV